MNPEHYHCSISANISAKEAFDGITQVAAWWTTNFTGNAQKLNDIFTVRFGETFVTARIAEAVAYKKIVWHVVDCHLNWLENKKEWMDTRVSWEIITNKDVTQVQMTHFGITPGAECYTTCVKGWDHHIKESLLRLLTQKEGLQDRGKCIVAAS